MLSVEKKSDKENKQWLVKQILDYGIEAEFFFEGNLNKKIVDYASLGESTDSDLAFCSSSDEKAIQQIMNSKAGVIFCKKELRGKITSRQDSLLVFLENPRLAFVSLANKIQKEKVKEQQITKISSTTVIEDNAIIGSNCIIGNFVYIGKNCVVGENTIIHDRVTLFQNCKIGKNCVIQSGVTLGEDGFAYERHENNVLEKFPHKKGVVIGDNVEISSNTNISRGSLTDTIISDDTKIDSMVHIAHNVRIGKKCIITGGTVIGGSAVIGDSCWTGLNSTIKNKIIIGNNVLVGAGACVINNIDDGDIVAGIPAKSIKSKVSSNEIFLMSGKKK